MKKRSYLAAATAVFMGGSILTGCGVSQAGRDSTMVPGGSGGVVQIQNVENQVISVNSREEVKITPDMAEITYSVYTQASDAKECQKKNGEDLNHVIEILKGMGFEETSIQTSNYDLDPIYDWDNGQKITGYEMETRVTVSDISIDRVGEVISASVDAGVNHIRSVTYMSSKYDEAYQEALKKAVQSAASKAQAMAEAGNCKLGPIVNINEYVSSQEAKYTDYRSSKAAAEAEAADFGAMNVMPGEVSIEANISVDFAVNR
ncbi:SIMPL domain-containing protein [Lachnospiraceae bacterium 62-35]